MKKFVVSLLAASLMLSCCACGGESGVSSVQADKNLSVSETQTEKSTVTPEPTNFADEDTLLADSSATSIASYDDLESSIESDTKLALTELSVGWKTLAFSVTDYYSYVEKSTEIEDFYTTVCDTTNTLCLKMREFSIDYAEAVLASGNSSDDMYTDLEGIYDAIYDDMGDEILEIGRASCRERV